MDIIHNYAASYFAERVNHGVVPDAGGGEDTRIRSNFTAVADDDWSDDVAA